MKFNTLLSSEFISFFLPKEVHYKEVYLEFIQSLEAKVQFNTNIPLPYPIEFRFYLLKKVNADITYALVVNASFKSNQMLFDNNFTEVWVHLEIPIGGKWIRQDQVGSLHQEITYHVSALSYQIQNKFLSSKYAQNNLTKAENEILKQIHHYNQDLNEYRIDKHAMLGPSPNFVCTSSVSYLAYNLFKHAQLAISSTLLKLLQDAGLQDKSVAEDYIFNHVTFQNETIQKAKHDTKSLESLELQYRSICTKYGLNGNFHYILQDVSEDEVYKIDSNLNRILHIAPFGQSKIKVYLPAVSDEERDVDMALRPDLIEDVRKYLESVKNFLNQ